MCRFSGPSFFYKETRWSGMHKQAGNHQRHAQQTPAHQRRPTRYTSHKRQSPNQAVVQASNQHTTLTSHRTLCHRGTRHRHRGTTPTADVTGTRAAHIQLKPKRPGLPVMKPRHSSAGALGRNSSAGALGCNKRNGRNLTRFKPRTLSHTHAHTYPLQQAWRLWSLLNVPQIYNRPLPDIELLSCFLSFEFILRCRLTYDLCRTWGVYLQPGRRRADWPGARSRSPCRGRQSVSAVRPQPTPPW